MQESLRRKCLATSDEKLLEKLEAYSEEMKQSVVESRNLTKLDTKIMNKKILQAFLCVCMVVVTGGLLIKCGKNKKKTYKILEIDADIRKGETVDRTYRTGREDA